MAKRTKPGMTGVPEAILPLTDFRDDPWATGDKNAASFRAGVMSSPVPAEFAQKMRDEGKAAIPEPAADKAEDQPAED